MENINIMTDEQVSEYLGLKLRKVQDMARANEIPNKKIGQKRIFVKSAIDEWLLSKDSEQSA